MKKSMILTFFFCLSFVLLSFIFCFIFVSPLFNSFGEDILPYCALGTFVFCTVVHDYVCRQIVCVLRKKNNVTDGCYFWNCPHYSVCPYNSNK